MSSVETTVTSTRPYRPGARRDFRKYLCGSGTSTFGTMFTGVATAALAVEAFQITGREAAMLRIAAALPVLFFAPLVGALVDRMPRPRRVLIVAELIAAVAVGLFAAGVATGVATFTLLLILTVGLGATTTLAATAFFTHLNSLRLDHLPTARAKMQTTDSAVGVGASALAGPIVAAFGPAVALVTDSISYLLSAAWLKSISTPDHNPARSTPTSARTIPQDLREGARVLLRSQLRPVVGYFLIFQAAFTGAVALKAIYLLRTLDIPLYLYGVPGLSAALLGIAGALFATRLLTAGCRPGRATAGWWVGSALSLLTLPIAGGPPVVAVSMVSLTLGVMSMCGAAGNVTLVALFSEAIPERAMGRVNGMLMVMGTLATIIGAPIAGELADRFGVRTALWVCATAGLCGLPLLRSWWRRDRPPATPSGRR
jgi:MFS family permease